MNEAYKIDKDIKKYTLKENSTLNAVIPTGRKDGVRLVSVSSPYRRDTFDSPNQLSPYGNITLTALSDRINIKYVCKKDFIDNDSFEFIMVFEDGTKILKIVDIQVNKKYIDDNINNNYYEYYLEQDSKNIELEFESK